MNTDYKNTTVNLIYERVTINVLKTKQTYSRHKTTTDAIGLQPSALICCHKTPNCTPFIKSGTYSAVLSEWKVSIPL